MLTLDNLSKIVKKRKRVGRGCSRGRKSGRGSKGQLSRSGGRAEIRPSFEGGQMSLIRRLPRRGFNNRGKILFEIISLAKIAGAFSVGAKIDRDSLIEKGLIKGRVNHLIKILGPVVEVEKMNFFVDAVSASVSKAISLAGGTISSPIKKESR